MNDSDKQSVMRKRSLGERIGDVMGQVLAVTMVVCAWLIIVLFTLKCVWFILFRFLM